MNSMILKREIYTQYNVVEFMQIISVITINESLMNINERL